MDYLEIIDSHGRRKRVRLDRPRLLIGREPNCDIHLSHLSVSRRHAQLQRTEQGLWVLQDLNSRNHIFVDESPVQQIVLNLGKQVRIADYRLVLRAAPSESHAEFDASATEDQVDDSWLEAEPGWLEQLQAFQRALLRLVQPRTVLEHLAAEFRRVASPHVVAVGLVGPERYDWELALDADGKPCPNYHPMEEVNRRASGEDSTVQVWTQMRATNDDTPSVPPPLCLLFPIKGRSGIIGHVFVQRPRFYPVPATVQRYLTLLVAHAGLVWDSLQVAALRGALQTFERELHLARQIQIELFPATFDLDERLNAFAVNLPTVQVSGDYYDLFRTGPDTVAFIIADAMGHGVPAALMMAAVRASLRMGLLLGHSWEAIFKGLDDIIAQARGDALVTGLVGQIDLKSRELHLVSAGHLPPSILVDGRPVPVPGHCQTRPWGLGFECPWEVGRLSLAGEHWSILCFTDGITDVSVHQSRRFGARRVAAYHLEHHRHSAEDLCLGLISEVAAQQGTESLPDDQTVLILRSAGTARE